MNVKAFKLDQGVALRRSRQQALVYKLLCAALHPHSVKVSEEDTIPNHDTGPTPTTFNFLSPRVMTGVKEKTIITVHHFIKDAWGS